MARYPRKIAKDYAPCGGVFMEEILKVPRNLGKHFNNDAWQQANKAKAAAPASALALALRAPPASTLAPASGSASALVGAHGDPNYFATWVKEKLDELPKNGLRLTM